MKKLYIISAALLSASTMSAQWGTSMNEPTALFPTGTNSYETNTKVGADGTVWAMVYHPNTKNAESEMDTKNVVYEYLLQCWDKEGNRKFGPEGLLISDYANLSYTVVNNRMMVDRDGNVIVAVSDARNSQDKQLSYTAYKISPEGEFLWGEDGIALSDAIHPAPLVFCSNVVQLEDGSYVFAWVESASDTSMTLYMQRLSQDGKKLWDQDKLAMKDDQCSYPYLINSGDNTAILVYSRTASKVIYARKIDFEGENVWGKDTRIYRGGWGSIPLQTLLTVTPSGDGGALIAWCDDRSYSNQELPYLSYVTSDGKLGFSGASEEGDVRLSYDDYRNFNVRAVPAADGSCFYAVWRITSTSQNYQGIKIQKISKKGELLFDEEGQSILDPETISLSYFSIQPAGADGACAFYEVYRSYSDQQGYAYRFDSKGEPVWEYGAIELTPADEKVTSLTSTVFPVGDTYLLAWCNGGSVSSSEDDTYYMILLNQDGTFGLKSEGVETVTDNNSTSLRLSGKTLFANGLPSGTEVMIYDAAGTLADVAVIKDGSSALNLGTGLYIAKARGCAPLKMFVK